MILNSAQLGVAFSINQDAKKTTTPKMEFRWITTSHSAYSLCRTFLMEGPTESVWHAQIKTNLWAPTSQLVNWTAMSLDQSSAQMFLLQLKTRVVHVTVSLSQLHLQSRSKHVLYQLTDTNTFRSTLLTSSSTRTINSAPSPTANLSFQIVNLQLTEYQLTLVLHLESSLTLVSQMAGLIQCVLHVQIRTRLFRIRLW